jgi:hypothetical protein
MLRRTTPPIEPGSVRRNETIAAVTKYLQGYESTTLISGRAVRSLFLTPAKLSVLATDVRVTSERPLKINSSSLSLGYFHPKRTRQLEWEPKKEASANRGKLQDKKARQKEKKRGVDPENLRHRLGACIFAMRCPHRPYPRSLVIRVLSALLAFLGGPFADFPLRGKSLHAPFPFSLARL